MSLLPLERLLHIRKEINYLVQCRAKHSLREIIHDEDLSRAVVRSLEIVGEATRNAPITQRLNAPGDAMQRMSRVLG